MNSKVHCFQLRSFDGYQFGKAQAFYHGLVHQGRRIRHHCVRRLKAHPEGYLFTSLAAYF